MIYLNIGSNLNSVYGDRKKNINMAINLIKDEQIPVIKISKFYETPSYPNINDPKFLNTCIQIEFNDSPTNLLVKLNNIEKKLHRHRKAKNEPRTCDIDIIDFKGMIIKNKNLTTPHPQCHTRNFVLFPLKEICPNWIHPIFNKKIDILIKKLNISLRNEITTLK